jgi:hypothetical protein
MSFRLDHFVRALRQFEVDEQTRRKALKKTEKTQARERKQQEREKRRVQRQENREKKIDKETKRQEEKNKRKKPQGFFERLVQKTEKCAARREVPFEIDAAFVTERAANGCALCGDEMTTIVASSSDRGRRFVFFEKNASIDEAVHNQGFTLQNAQITHVRCNLMKMDLSNTSFRKLCDLVSSRESRPPVPFAPRDNEEEKKMLSFVLHLAKNTKGRAKKNSLPYEIEDDWIREDFRKNINCRLCGEPMLFCRNESQEKIMSFKFPRNMSIDQISHKNGYAPGNVQLVHVQCNISKKDMTNDAFFATCQKIASNLL